ncbi:hypothetical protein SDC9_209384 [bioreactor metagenome]|uniref:Uncharacterized protein n=1 Tax=bioreactor metagenome TaxID=1076179 RepID=A0A645JDV1_9ZZZZ
MVVSIGVQFRNLGLTDDAVFFQCFEHITGKVIFIVRDVVTSQMVGAPGLDCQPFVIIINGRGGIIA